MYTLKKPEAEVRLLYPKMMEMGLAAAMLLLALIFTFSKRIESTVVIQKADEVVLETEEIPITQQVKRPPPPARPSIPVEDPDVSEEDDLLFEDIDDIDWQAEAPPPPPSVEDEIVDFFAVEVTPKLVGGEQALQKYLVDHNLYPEMALRAQIQGVAIIRFIVETDGTPSNLEIFQERPAGLGFGEAGVKAMTAMRFTPGMQRDRKVRVPMQQVIRFQLQ